MNDKLKELIQPYWIEEQQGVYIPLIDKVLLKNNVPEMHYEDYMEYAKSNGVQIATKDELLQMYLQKDEINKILREHNGDMLDTWFGSSSEYGLYYEWCVNFGSGYCYNATKLNYNASRAVVDLKSKKTNNMKQFNLEEYKKNPNRRVITRDGKNTRIVCTDMIGTSYPILAVCRVDATHDCDYSYTLNGKHNLGVDSRLDLFFAPEKHEGWTHVYKLGDAGYIAGNIYNTKEEALKHPIASKISTVKIEWEE